MWDEASQACKRRINFRPFGRDHCQIEEKGRRLLGSSWLDYTSNAYQHLYIHPSTSYHSSGSVHIILKLRNCFH